MFLNHVSLWGRLVADPELRQTSSGDYSLRITVAVPRKTYGKRESKTDFIKVQVWNKQAEFVSRYFGKGSAILIIGTMQNNNYTDKQGNDRFETIVIADDIQFGESKANSNTPAARGETVQPVSYQPNSAGTQDFTDLDGFEEIGNGSGLPF